MIQKKLDKKSKSKSNKALKDNKNAERYCRITNLDGCTVACSLVTFPMNWGGLPGSEALGGLFVLQIINLTPLKN